MALGGSDLLECSICLQTLENPHLIPRCGHTFCLGCIQRLNSNPQCPLCRQCFDPRQVSPNFAVQHLVEAAANATNAPRMSGTEHGNSTISFGDQVIGVPILRRQRSSVDFSEQAYRALGVPPALANVLATEDSEIASRIYLLDNSGSMGAGDGSIFKRSANGHLQKQIATRWEELVEMSVTHAAWNRTLGVPCEFVLLNSPNPAQAVDGRDIFQIDAQKGDALAQERAMQASLSRLHPSGTTPLAERLENIRARLLRQLEGLIQSGQKVLLTIATDGIPNSRPAFVQSLRRLMYELPVRVTIRLCTDESKVVDFYNDLDRDVEMHTIREAGTFIGILDYLDERRLTPMEVAFCSSLLMQDEGRPAYPRDPEEFLLAIEDDINEAVTVFDVRRRAFLPPLDFERLQAAVLPKQYAGLAGVVRGMGLGGLVDWYFQPVKSESETESVSSDESEKMCRFNGRQLFEFKKASFDQ